MKLSTSSWFLLAVAKLLLSVPASALGDKKVLLRNVQSLTLRKDHKTTHRRVAAVPQLKCVGGSGCRYYQVEVMRCENVGSDYDENSIQWTCRADVPEEVKLGATDVKCEGYTSPSDPYILKGSCGVEYTLLLTDKGIKRYGQDSSFSYSGSNSTGKLFGSLFWLLFFGVVITMVISAYNNMNHNRGAPRRPPNRPPRWFGGGGGGDGPDDPPPPYTQFPPRPPRKSTTAGNWGGGQQQAGYQPGFWTGLLGGAAAGYMAGRRGNNQRDYGRAAGGLGGTGWGGYDNDNGGEGSSTSASGSGNFHTSTGFGGTSNR